MSTYKLIEGTKFTDERGELNFFNAFNMGEILRFYEIAPNDTETIRAWQGHKKEKKWFYCNSGAFLINLIKLDDFDNPSGDIAPEKIFLDSKDPKVLEISGGFANGFKATQEGSKLLVFSDATLEASKEDDYRYPASKWVFEF